MTGDKGVELNQQIRVAVAEPLSALRAELALGGRAVRADRLHPIETLAQIGQGNPLREHDELSGSTPEHRHLQLVSPDQAYLQRTWFR